MYSQLFVFAELTVADNGFHKAGELYLVREYLVQWGQNTIQYGNQRAK